MPVKKSIKSQSKYWSRKMYDLLRPITGKPCVWLKMRLISRHCWYKFQRAFFYWSELASPSPNKVTCPSYLTFALCTLQSWHLSSFLVTFFVVQHQKPWNFSWIVSISLKEVCPILSCLVFISGFFATSTFSAWLSRLMVHLTILVFNLHLVLRSGGLLVQQVLFTWLARSSF